MLRMSKLADYAFVILSHMAAGNKETWSASALAQETALPLPTVAKLMKLLAKNEVVSAQRGAMGGYSLVQDAKKTTIATIIEAVDGPISLTECAGAAKGEICKCLVEKSCPVRESWSRVNTAIRQALETVYLSDLLPHEMERHPTTL